MKSQARILVVDDDEDIRHIVTRTLEKMGYGVLAVGSGLQAVSAVTSRKFRLALVDIKMADMEGRKTIVEIHKCAPNMPVIVMTGSPHSELGELQATVQGWLYKPFRLAQLRSLVERVLGEPSRKEP